MKTILEHPLQTIKLQQIWIPEEAILLNIQIQNGGPCLWVLCDPERKSVHQNIETYMTGHAICEPIGNYIGTYQLDRVVYHAFKTPA